MDAIAVLLLIVTGLLGLDIAANFLGVDSRDGFREDDPAWRFR